MEKNENTEQNAAEQAAQAPDVATAGATDATAAVEAQHTTEKEAENAEHLDRRENPRLPDPQAEAAKPDPAQTDPSTQTFLSDQNQSQAQVHDPGIPAEQLASDGDAVKEGLPEEGKEAGA